MLVFVTLSFMLFAFKVFKKRPINIVNFYLKWDFVYVPKPKPNPNPRLLAERSDTKSNVKIGGFQSQLQTS